MLTSKAVILAGGFGTRISEEAHLKPKPMVEIGGRPILWHIMKIYSAHGVRDFVICCGYKGYLIKEYFANYFLHMSDVTIDMDQNKMKIHQRFAEPWRVTLVDTGENTQTGGRLRRVRNYLDPDSAFFFTYGDGLADIDIGAQMSFHRAHGRLATVMAVNPPGRFGVLTRDGDRVVSFTEKSIEKGGEVNGGFFILSPKVLDYIGDDQTSWEEGPLSRLAREGELIAYHHKGFWQPMDTMREKNQLEDLWISGRAPWKTWT
jgi:glucose-1-phosphate cytidylyltransferase